VTDGSHLAELHDVRVAREQPVVQDLPLGGPVQVGAAAGDELDGHLLACAAVVRQLHKARGACRPGHILFLHPVACGPTERQRC
jgi:hypothetical protein